MNDQRRKQIRKALDILLQVKEEEQEALDNMPEGLRNSDRGQAIEDALSSLESACDELESAFGSLENVCDELESAFGSLENVCDELSNAI